MANIKQIKIGNTTYNIEPVTSYLPLSGGTMTGTFGFKSNYLVKPVAEFRTQSERFTGAITIALPAGISNTMVSMWIDVYNYVTNTSFSVHVGGYTYNNETWQHNPFAMVYGENHTVRLGHNGTNFVIYIGETNSTWYYPQISVRNVILGYNPVYGNWKKEWGISFVTSFSNVSAVINNYAWTTKNFTPPTSLPASDVYAWAKAPTKPSYTKSEVGLGNVDNTADANKNVNYANSAGNADTVDSLHIHSGRNNEANKIVRTDGSGYLQTGWINNSSSGWAHENAGHGNDAAYQPYKLLVHESSGDTYIRGYDPRLLNVRYAGSAGNADTVDGKHSSDFCLSNSNITNLPINGGIYWNSYVESSSDGSDAASITVIRDGNGNGGTVLQIKQANDNNDIVNVVAGDLRLNGTSVSTHGHDHDDRYYTESEVNSKLDGKSNTGHTHSSVTDIGNSTATTFAYSKSGLNYGDYTWLAGWNGYELRAVNKSQFATSSHTHDDRYYTESEINTKLDGKSNTNHTHNYLPLSGGTMDGTLIFSKDSNGIKFASDAWYITNIEAGSTSVQIGTAAAGYTTSITVTFKDYKHGSGSWYVVATVAGNNPAEPECVIAGISDLTTSGVKIRVRKIANNSGTGNPVWNINWIAIKYW